MRRINVSVDTLDAEKFHAITRWGDLDQVLAGIDAAQAAGIKVKLNAVALKGVNEHEIPELMRWAHGRGMDLTVIETMPMGEIDEDRTDQYLPLSLLRARPRAPFTLTDIPYKTGGPARYVEVAETGGRLGFITPMTHNFCESCNRVRLTCTGTLYMCLGQDDAADLRAPLRASEGNELLSHAIDEAIGRKPKGHDFIIDRRTKRPGRLAPHERHRRLIRPALAVSRQAWTQSRRRRTIPASSQGIASFAEDAMVEDNAAPADGAKPARAARRLCSLAGNRRWRKAERARLIEARLAIPADVRAAHGGKIAQALDAAIGPIDGRLVSLYWPFRGEPDLRPWMAEIDARGGRTALPVVIEKAKPLVFRA